MKIVIGILLVILGTYLVGFFLPQSYEVSRSIVIAAPKAEVHATLQDVTTWKDWSAFVPFGDSAADVHSKFEGPQAGAGATWIWGRNLGDKPARFEVLASDVNWGIGYKLELDGGRVTSDGEILLQDTNAGGTTVTFVNGGEMPTPWRRYFYFIAEKAVGPALSQSLEGLKVRLDGGDVPAQQGGAVGNPNGQNSPKNAQEPVPAGTPAGTE
ncbi:MAG: hypothetical protein GY930_01690 [bacterium]|nr:hypothetical protein [bacterium]